jgi:hypothetical protein
MGAGGLDRRTPHQSQLDAAAGRHRARVRMVEMRLGARVADEPVSVCSARGTTARYVAGCAVRRRACAPAHAHIIR